MKVKTESEVTQLCLTLSDPMDCSLPGSSIHGIFQARVLEWGATAFSHLHTRQLIFTNQDDVLSEDHDPYGELESVFKTTSLYHANYLHKIEERSSILTSI